VRIQKSTRIVPATGAAVDRRYHRQVLAARAGRQQVPNARHDHPTAAPSERKQPGRKFGPPPKKPPHPRMQAPEPMTTGDRDKAYRRAPSFYTMTARQERQWVRMAERHGEVVRDRRGAKAHATPKRRGAAR
jgi:hypothetical protein